jgi:hypothetical protein
MTLDESYSVRGATKKRLFTIDEANAMLPLVKAITVDLVELSREVIERRERLALLTGGRDIEGTDPYSQELAQVQQEIRWDIEKLNGFVAELRELGVEPKNAAEGIVDFPSELDGRLIYLCWKHGEAEVLYWHEVEGGFDGRQAIFAEVGFDGDLNGH